MGCWCLHFFWTTPSISKYSGCLGAGNRPDAAHRASVSTLRLGELHSRRSKGGSVLQEASTQHPFALYERSQSVDNKVSEPFFFYAASWLFKFQRSFVCSRQGGGAAESAFYCKRKKNLAKGERKCGRAAGRGALMSLSFSLSLSSVTDETDASIVAEVSYRVCKQACTDAGRVLDLLLFFLWTTRLGSWQPLLSIMVATHHETLWNIICVSLRPQRRKDADFIYLALCAKPPS